MKNAAHTFGQQQPRDSFAAVLSAVVKDA